MIRVTRSRPAPASLAKQKKLASGKYNCPDVVEQLKTDFRNKCYLCEEPTISKIEVEHLEPHGGNRDLMFDWDNLFFCCGHCNGTKNDLSAWPILDCTDHAVPVLSRLRYSYEIGKEDMRASVVVEAVEGDIATRKTAELITRIYGGKTAIRGVEAENVLEKMQKSCHRFFMVVRDLASGRGSQEDQAKWRGRVSRGLAPETGFTAIRAWKVIQGGLADQFRGELEILGYYTDPGENRSV